MHNESAYTPHYQPMGYPGQGQSLGAHPNQGFAHPTYARGQGAAQYQVPHAPYPGYPNTQFQTQTPFTNLGNDRFLKGLLIGAAAAYILTNESVQRTAIKGVVKAWSMLQGGVEEIKERFQDAEAEIRAAEAGHQE